MRILCQYNKQLKIAIKENWKGKLATDILLLHDNAPVHKSKVAQAAICEFKSEQFNHPPYSPDLAQEIIIYLEI